MEKGNPVSRGGRNDAEVLYDEGAANGGFRSSRTDTIKKKKKKRAAFSKRLSLLIFWSGIIITFSCLVLIAYAIRNGFTATASYLTAAIALPQAMIMSVANHYLNNAKAEHTAGGITYEAAKANNWQEGEHI